MKTINSFELTKTATIERANENDMLEVFYTIVTNKYHVIFNAKTMGTYKTKAGAVNLANRLINKHALK